MRQAAMRQTAMRFSAGLEYRKEDPVKISLLINSIYYFIESVFIMELREGYRLLVLHRGRVLADEIYKTVKGARIAFVKMYG
ncbi:MAG: hypothetical protein GY950_15210, partial [bacterium]|nr:hypothetical protein [bacterium]